MATCPTLSTGDAFLSTMLRHIDCQSQTLGEAGYRVLADPTAPVSLALTALLTVFIALFGLRMILGETPSVREGVLAVVKIGVVLVVATSWPAYRTVVYDAVVAGPGQIASSLGRPIGLPGANGDLIARLQAADVAINRLITLGSGRSDLVSVPPTGTGGAGEPDVRVPIADDPAFGMARVLFLSTTVAGLAIVRLTAGVLLALGPLFAGMLLFDATRGLFVGWLRALVFTLFASIATTIVFGVQLALLEPWLTQVLQLRFAKIIAAAAPIELLVACLGFALALAGIFAVLLRLAFTTSVSFSWPATAFAASAAQAPAQPPSLLGPAGLPRQDTVRNSARAEAVAGAMMAAERRERLQVRERAAMAGASLTTTAARTDEFAIPTFGQAARRTKPRKSIGARTRDRRT